MTDVKIIVVEDESIVAEDIKRSLQNMGYSVPAVVASAEEAVKKAEEIRPNLILMDIMLRGEGNGIDAAGRIRIDYNIPVVYLTAYSDDEILERAKLTEPFGFIIKPFENRELRSVIEMALYKHRMELQLKESREWLSTVLNSIGDAVITTDSNGSVLFMNPVAELLTGWQQEEAKGRELGEVFRIINEDTEEAIANPVKQVFSEGTIVGLANHTMLIAKDGTQRPIDDSAAPIKDSKGNIAGVVVVFHDISERRRMEKSIEEKMEELKNFYDMAIGRELKMKDLKNDIAKLEDELSQYKRGSLDN